MGEIWIPLSASSSTSQRASASSSDGPATASGLQLRGHVEAIARIVLVYSVIAVLTEAPNSRECLKIAPHSSRLYGIMTQPQCGRLKIATTQASGQSPERELVTQAALQQLEEGIGISIHTSR